MISKTDSTPFIYSREHIRVKVYSEVTFVAPSCTSAANTIIVILKWTRREQGCRRASVDSAESTTVQSILPHAKIQTTLDLYTQEDSGETRAAQFEFLTAVGMNATVDLLLWVDCGPRFSVPIIPKCFGMNGGDDETRTRDLRRGSGPLKGFTTTHKTAGTAKGRLS